MNRNELVTSVAKKLNLPKNQVDSVLTTSIETIKKTVKTGDDVSLIGFGTFTKTKRAARMGMNPSTGEKLQIKASVVPKFRPGKAFKELLTPKAKK